MMYNKFIATRLENITINVLYRLFIQIIMMSVFIEINYVEKTNKRNV